jgi:hypothetical protein
MQTKAEEYRGNIDPKTQWMQVLLLSSIIMSDLDEGVLLVPYHQGSGISAKVVKMRCPGCGIWRDVVGIGEDHHHARRRRFHLGMN